MHKRLTEKGFREFEGYIRQIVSRYPLATVFSSANFWQTQSTFASRLRDAMKTLHENRWLSGDRFQDDFDRVFAHIAVGELDNGDVAIGTREQLKELRGGDVPLPVQQPSDQPVIVPPMSFAEACLVAMLVEQNAFSRPIILQLAPSQAIELEKNYDIALTKTDQGYLIK